MTLRQINYLLAVAETGSFTAAAQRMSVSQPSLSQQIRALEAELGGQLLDRPPREVKLTAAGRAFLADARAAVDAANRAAETARATMATPVQELRVATVMSLAVSQLPAVIRRWQSSHPGMTVHLREYAHRDLVRESLLDGEADLAIAPRPARWRGAVKRLGWDELVVVLPEAELPRAPASVSLGGLAGREWVLFEPGHGLSNIATTVCREEGFQPHGVAFTAQVEAACRLAASGVGPALVPVKAVPPDLAANVRRLDPPVVWEIAAYTTAERWPAQTRELLGVLSEEGWQTRRPPGSHRFPS